MADEWRRSPWPNVSMVLRREEVVVLLLDWLRQTGVLAS